LFEERPNAAAVVKVIIAADDIEVTTTDERAPINKQFFNKYSTKKGQNLDRCSSYRIHPF
jgi:hypothetical protein